MGGMGVYLPCRECTSGWRWGWGWRLLGVPRWGVGGFGGSIRRRRGRETWGLGKGVKGGGGEGEGMKG